MRQDDWKTNHSEIKIATGRMHVGNKVSIWDEDPPQVARSSTKAEMYLATITISDFR